MNVYDPSHLSDSGATTARGRTLVLAVLCGLLLVVLLVLGQGTSARAADPTLPLSAVQPGMVGYAKTVATGTAVTTFTVEVIDTVSNQNNGGMGVGQNLILFRASGDLINQTQGIVAGMSGSPIYFEDPGDHVYKVAGAISYGFDAADGTIALATPIEEMTPLLQLSGVKSLVPAAGVTYGPSDGKPIDLGGARVLKSVYTGTGVTPAGATRVKPLSTPICISGVSAGSSGFTRLAAALQKRGFSAVAAPGASARTDFSGATIEPGASLGAGVVTGDTTAAAMGTVTYVDDTKIIGFGHPFYWSGATNFPMMTGYVHTIVPSILGGFKLVSAGDTTGTITQDRNTGIAGRLAQTPTEASLTVTAVNADEPTTVVKHYGIASGLANSDPYLVAMFSGFLAGNTNSMAVDQMRGGTADTTFTINGMTATGQSVHLDLHNKTYDPYDVAWAGYEFEMYMDMLLENGIQDVNLTTVTVSNRLTSARKTATILDASLLGRTLTPGRTMTVRVYMQPYNSESLTSVDVTLAIPAGVSRGATLEVESNDGSYQDVPPDWYSYATKRRLASPSTVQAMIERLEAQQVNNEMKITLSGGYGYGYPPSPTPGGGATGVASPATPARSVTKTFATDYVLSGAVAKDMSAITVAARPNPVVYGRAVTFRGAVYDLSDPYSGLDATPTVELWAKPYGAASAQMVKSVNGSTRTGGYSLSYVPTSTTQFFTRFTGTEYVIDADSSLVWVKVEVKVAMSLGASRIRLGRSVAITGSVSPTHAGSTVLIQRKIGFRWVTIRRPVCDSGGHYSTTWSPSRRGTYHLRAVWRDSDSSHLTNTSVARILQVI